MLEAPHSPFGAPPAGYTGPKRSLILAGGGMRVAYQAGTIRALLDAGLCFAHGDGTSGGIINLAMLFSGLSPSEMCDRWRTLNVHDFVSLVPLEQYLKSYDMLAMGDADGIVSSVFPHLGVDAGMINAAQGMEATFNVCNYTRKINEAIPHDKVDLDLLVAGISLPIFMPPVRRGDYLYTDSVWIKDANLMEAVKRGADELWVVWCIGNTGEYKTGIFNQYVHMIEMSANGSLFEEFDRINEVNDRIRKGEAVYGHTRPVKLHLIKPDYPLPLDPDFYLGRIDAATLIDMGYADGVKYLRNMEAEGLPFEPETTRMEDSTLGITFRETMQGGFALGETDPAAGDGKGDAQKSALSMHISVNIRDLHRFVGDPQHTGSIAGHISFPPFGENILARGGLFNLFSPTGKPGLKLMVYELAFDHGGQEYYLLGRKEVRDDAGFDLLRDTTTLFMQLHRGSDKTGEVLGAGILRVKPGELLDLVTSLHVVNAKSVKEKAQALSDFGGLFFGELWKTYSKPVRV